MSGTGRTTSIVNKINNQYVDGLLTNEKWADSTIYYSFSVTAAAYANYTQLTDLPGNFRQISDEQRDAIDFALSASDGPVASRGFSIEGFTNANIQSLGDTDAGNAHIRFGGTSSVNLGTARVADFPANYATGQIDDNGDVWFGNAYDYTDGDYRFPVAGNYAWHTHLHEIGHAMGLKHGQENSVFGPLPSDADSMEFTVMTYRSYVNDPLIGGYSNEEFGYAQTYMMLDIVALQYMYGADYSTNSSDTVYSWDPSSGDTRVNGAVGIDAGGNRIFATLWDGGGVDTYNLSAYGTDLSLDLRPGFWSVFDASQLAYLGDANYARANIFNALMVNDDTRSLIENAIGGSGNDTIRGNQIANRLEGGAGDDILIGGEGGDRLVGGSGSDRADYSTAADGVVTDLQNASANTGDAAGDTYSSIENLYGSNQRDILRGNSGANSLWGGGGNDSIYGRDGNDRLYGGAGDDNLLGGTGNDAIQGGSGNDMLEGGAGADTLDGGTGLDVVRYSSALTGLLVDLLVSRNNTGEAAGDTFVSIEGIWGSDFSDSLRGDDLDNAINGAAGIDSLYGRGGDDILMGGAGADILNGGSGSDTAQYNNTSGLLVVDLANAAVNTREAAGDSYVSIENLWGSAGADSLRGNSGSNILDGNSGDDVLYGRDGNDILVGGAGADILNGGNGTDRASYSGFHSELFVTGGVVADLQVESNNTGDAAGDRYISIENLYGTQFNDSLRGDAGANTIWGSGGRDTLYGRDGNDRLYGGSGNDILVGGRGNDVLDGGSGADRFRFALNDGNDTIRNFEDNVDKIEVPAGTAVIIADAGNDTLVSFLNVTVLLEGVDHNTISSVDDFIYS
ncbi:serralysin [Devosia yakushimensis]|uniref:Serralysin n=1 Tax=Devosia yakushimensis TaxID=470028 RepID=A0ABQ5UGP3_9HYPH|nr:M10 family metallopeptidase [Devosia yakushimensis]GLQ11239.1 serralysin [Devosia yakushimensis]